MRVVRIIGMQLHRIILQCANQHSLHSLQPFNLRLLVRDHVPLSRALAIVAEFRAGLPGFQLVLKAGNVRGRISDSGTGVVALDDAVNHGLMRISSGGPVTLAFLLGWTGPFNDSDKGR